METAAPPATPATPDAPILLDVRAVGRLLSCSPRHVYRLADSGRLSRPVALGRLVARARVVEG